MLPNLQSLELPEISLFPSGLVEKDAIWAGRFETWAVNQLRTRLFWRPGKKWRAQVLTISFTIFGLPGNPKKVSTFGREWVAQKLRIL